MSNKTPAWLRWSRELIAIAQSGLDYANNPYDVERYTSVRRIALRISDSRR